MFIMWAQENPPFGFTSLARLSQLGDFANKGTSGDHWRAQELFTISARERATLQTV